MTALLLATMIACSNPQPMPIETLTEQVVVDQEYEISADDMELFKRVVMGEAGNQGLEGMTYVASVVLNRVDDPDFPDTVGKVLRQPSQFYKGYKGVILDECEMAIELALHSRPDNEIVFFCSTGYNYYGTPAYQIGDHWFSTK